jgi:ribose/xylose/arabinose/galactoside ABC-type transport system permease subunit
MMAIFPAPTLLLAGVLFVLLACGLGILLHLTRFGRYLYAIGASEQAALLAGIPVRRIKRTVYLLSSLLAGLTAYLCRALQPYWVLPETKLATAPLFTLDSMPVEPLHIILLMLALLLICLIGGIRPGQGTVIGTVMGTFIVTLLTNIMHMLLFSAPLQSIILATLCLLLLVSQNNLDNE